MNRQPGQGLPGAPGEGLTPSSGPPPRDLTIDVLRGLAIVSMVAAHLSPALQGPAPLWLRIFGSIAAPLFILLSGMMVAFTTRCKGRDLRYFLRRGGFVLAVGILVDLFIWNIYPLLSFDVLYLIGFSLPLTFLALGFSDKKRYVLVLLIFLSPPLLQQHFGYTDYPTEITLTGSRVVSPQSPTGIINHWLVDGWFPIFPWLGFSLLGTILADLRWRTGRDGRFKAERFNSRRFLIVGFSLAVLGSMATAGSLDYLAVRGGYAELFYPPTPGYLAAATGVCLLLFFLVDLDPIRDALRPLEVLGKHSLFMYALHLALIRYLVYFFWPEETLEAFLLVYLGLVALMMAVGERMR